MCTVSRQFQASETKTLKGPVLIANHSIGLFSAGLKIASPQERRDLLIMI
jgi:hypothetical protein